MVNVVTKKLITVICVFFIGACATTNSNAPKEWSHHKEQAIAVKYWNLFGRIAVSTPDESFTANIAWKKHHSGQSINIYNSLGNSYLKLKLINNKKSNNVTLELRDGKIIKGRTIQEVMGKVVDWPLPIHLLDFWVRGIPVADKKTTNLLFNADGSINQQTYLNWHIDYSRYADFDGQRLPKRLKVTHQDYSLKLSIRKWFK
jgi:outer membrane lipoprotein LolB